MTIKRTEFMWVHEAISYLQKEGIADRFTATPDRDIIGWLSSEEPGLPAAAIILERPGGITVDYRED